MGRGQASVLLRGQVEDRALRVPQLHKRSPDSEPHEGEGYIVGPRVAGELGNMRLHQANHVARAIQQGGHPEQLAEGERRLLLRMDLYPSVGGVLQRLRRTRVLATGTERATDGPQQAELVRGPLLRRTNVCKSALGKVST